mgnify:CR=1 FL=1|jgi:transcription antitermination protein NusB
MEPVKSTNRKMQRRDNRIAAMQYLYQWELNKPEVLADGVCQFFSQLDNPRDYYAFGEELAHGVLSQLQVVDEEIREHTRNWRFERIAKVDLAILRLAIYELLFRTDIPPVVSINEAIDLSKLYSSPDSKRFVNGILDQMKNKITRPLRTALQ